MERARGEEERFRHEEGEGGRGEGGARGGGGARELPARRGDPERSAQERRQERAREPELEARHGEEVEEVHPAKNYARGAVAR